MSSVLTKAEGGAAIPASTSSQANPPRGRPVAASSTSCGAESRCVTISPQGQPTTFACTDIPRCSLPYDTPWSYFDVGNSNSGTQLKVVFAQELGLNSVATIVVCSAPPGTYNFAVGIGEGKRPSSSLKRFSFQVIVIGQPPTPLLSFCGTAVVNFSPSRSASQQKPALGFEACLTSAIATPIAEIVYERADGELGTDDNGRVSIIQGPPEVGYELPETGTSALQGLALPSGYITAPPYLSISTIEYSRINASLLESIFTQNGGCSVVA